MVKHNEQPQGTRTAPKETVATRLRRLGSHTLAFVGAVAVALALEAWVGDGFTWLPRSPLAWLAALGVFVLGEGFLHWFLRQAKLVAEQDVAFQGFSSPPGRDPGSEYLTPPPQD
jgi:hypothetical protein